MRLVNDTWVGIISVCVAAASVASSIVLEVRRRAESRNAERARTAAELAQILERLGTAGLDQGLDSATAVGRHHNQLRELHVAVRKNTAEYARKAQKQGMSAAAIATFFLEGVLVLYLGLVIGSRVELVDGAERWIAALIAIAFCFVGVALIATGLLSNINRIDRMWRVANAGVKVSWWKDELRQIVPAFRVIGLRLRRRRQAKVLKSLSQQERPERGKVDLESARPVVLFDGSD